MSERRKQMAEPRYQDAFWQDGFWRSADGLRLHYRDYPGNAAKAPVLCIPGLTRNARDFEGVAARLAGTRRVIVVDLRGRGLSEHSSDPLQYAPPVYLQDLLALIAGHALPPMIVIGTSLGGLLAMLIAAAARPSVAGVVLNDIGPAIGEAGLARIRSYVGKDMVFAGWDAAARAIAANHAAAFPDYKHADWRTWARRTCREEEDGRVRFDYDAALAEPFKLPPLDQPFDLWAAFESLADLPTALIRGAGSDVLEAGTASEMVRRLPEMDYVTLPRIGHAPTLEEPEAVAAVDRLMRRVDESWRNPAKVGL